MGLPSTDPSPPASFKAWLANYDTSDPIHDIAVVQVMVQQVLTEYMNVQKNRVVEINDKIKNLNDLMSKVRERMPTGAADAAGAFDSQHRNSAENQKIFADMAAWGVDLQGKNAGSDVTPNQVNAWLTSLQKVTEKLTGDANTINLSMQNTLGKVNTYGDGSSASIKNLVNMLNSIFGNMRGSV